MIFATVLAALCGSRRPSCEYEPFALFFGTGFIMFLPGLQLLRWGANKKAEVEGQAWSAFRQEFENRAQRLGLQPESRSTSASATLPTLAGRSRAPLRCRKCGLISPAETLRCDCGDRLSF